MKHINRVRFSLSLLAMLVLAFPLAVHADSGGTNAEQAYNMEVVGHNDLGMRGFNADVWVHKGYAYVGQWGFGDWAGGSKDRFCPAGSNTSALILDVRVPSNPQVVGRLQNPPNTSIEDIVVYTAQYGPYKGHEIAAGGIQTCTDSLFDPSVSHGLMLWDVTNPAEPIQLAYFNTGCCAQGVHEFEVEPRTDLRRTFAYATVPTSRYPDSTSPSGYLDRNGYGPFRLIDITDPAHPFQVSDWGIQDIGGPFYAGQGCEADPNYGHGAEPSEDGKLVFLSYWDSGFIALDLTNPAQPVYKGRTIYPANADGDAHSASYDDTRKLLFSADEDFCKTGQGIEKGQGYLRVWDYSNLAAPVQIGSFRTPNSSGSKDQAAGDYSIHNALVVGTDIYMSWYSDGIRVADASNPTALREVAYFVPASVNNPVKPSQRGVLTNAPEIWGVAYDETTGLIYASDMTSGLWILRRTDK
jgi:hypothetical protein